MFSATEVLYLLIMGYVITELYLDCSLGYSNNCQVQGLCIFQISHVLSIFLKVSLLYIAERLVQPRYKRIAESIGESFGNIYLITFIPYLYYWASKKYEPIPNLDTITVENPDKDPVSVELIFNGKHSEYLKCEMPASQAYGEIYFLMYILMFIAIVVILAVIAMAMALKTHRQGAFKRKMDKLLTNAYLDPNALANFYEQNKTSIAGMKLTQQEIIVFKDQFEREFKHVKRQDYNQCVICFSDLEPEEKCISFPGCGHNYHFQCLECWLDKGKTNCPVCKTEFRDNFAVEISKKMETEFIKVSKSQEELQHENK